MLKNTLDGQLTWGGDTRPRALCIAVAAAFGCLPLAALSNPTGGVAVHGQATFDASKPNTLVVTTQNGVGTNHSAINWQSFSIPAGSTTRINQPSATSMSINRVVTNTPTQIFGTLSSNGKVVLVNQAGIAVGTGAVVDTAGFTASAVGMSDADALAGRQRFDGNGLGASTGVLSVQGNIIARGGDVVLIAPTIDLAKTAVVESEGGNVILAAGQSVEVTGRGLEGIHLQVQAPSDQAINLGTLKGDAVGIFAGTLKHSGHIQATSATLEGGKVVLKAKDKLLVDGTVRATALDGKGGVVHASANSIVLNKNTLIDVSNAQGGGEILVGGGWHGQDSRIDNAKQTIVVAGAQLKADATQQGNGGDVVVWADGLTRYSGMVSSKGGATGGNGGHVEVSGKQALDFVGAVDLTAAHGGYGSLLLDPDSIEIGTTAAVDGSTGDVSGNILSGSYTGVASRITASAVSALLNSGNLTLEATGNISVTSAIAKSTGGAQTLNLTGGSINISAPISSSSNALLVNLTANSGNIVATSGISSNGGSVFMTATGGYIEVKDVSSKPSTGAGGNISFTTTGGGHIKLGVGGGNIDAQGAAPGASGDIYVNSSGFIGMQSGYTAYANDVKLSAVGGITNNAGGAATIQATRIHARNSGSGDVRLQHTGTNDITLHNLTGNSDPGVFNNATGGAVDISSTQGKIILAHGVSSTAGDIVLTADKLDLNAAINSGSSSTGTVTLKPWSNSANISLGVIGDSTASTLELSASEVSNVTTGILKIGGTGYSGGIAVNGAIAPTPAGILSLINGGSITQAAGATITATKLNAHGVTGVTLNEANVVGTLAGATTSGAFSFTNAGNLTIGTADINSGISNSGTGTVSLTSSSGALSLTQAISATSSVLNLSAGAGISQSGAGTIAASTMNLTNGTGGITLTGANQVSNIALSNTSSAITLNNNKTSYALNVATVSDLTVTGTGALNLGGFAGAGNVSLSSNGGILATNISASGTLALTTANNTIQANGAVTAGGVTTINAGTGNVNLSSSTNDLSSLSVAGGVVNVRDANVLTVTSASGSAVTFNAGSFLNIDGNVTASTGAVSLTGSNSVVVTGAGVSSASTGGGATVTISSGPGLTTIRQGSYVSGKSIALTAGTTVLDASTLKPGGLGAIGTVTVSGDLTMQGGATIAMDVASASSFDTVSIGGTLSAASGAETVAVTDLSSGSLSGALSGPIITTAGLSGSALVMSGPSKWTLASSANNWLLTTAASVTPVVKDEVKGDLVTAFLDKLEQAAEAPEDKKKDKDVLLVEGEICKP